MAPWPVGGSAPAFGRRDQRYVQYGQKEFERADQGNAGDKFRAGPLESESPKSVFETPQFLAKSSFLFRNGCVKVLHEVEESLPFALLRLDSDNGGDF